MVVLGENNFFSNIYPHPKNGSVKKYKQKPATSSPALLLLSSKLEIAI